ncbi:hypothetical protein LTR78_002213 [Recurvomyces mirabilis]|uniref:Uncharacterized protein n=1 Tax=Recurvomyces mirabilis TaxID=574656 RepID=A0AAE0WUN6_9PEZI|nr:hypothetical protein LTR78_002213 [Recurvomyces mirabilis]KAK5160669.1 hypothetical protein LTS14_001681 [Recurvomyces mirabilis]
MAVHTSSPNANAFVRFMRKAYNPIGFKKGYNFILFFIFAGALFGFCLAKIQSLNVNGYWMNHNAPGESFWFGPDNRFYNIMIHIHLCTCIPAGLLGVWQFVPVIRYKALIFHRINGYIVILLLLVSNVGAVGVARRAFGGSLATQVFVGVLALLTTTSIFLAWWNIKVLQIDQHRAWMLRLFVYLGTIVTIRLITIVIAAVLSQGSKYFTYFMVMECQKIASMAGPELLQSYPTCITNPYGLTIVRANFTAPVNVAEVAAALALPFGVSCWLALTLHVIGIELYLRLTPVEGERLRRVSYERQLERGLEPAGSAGLVVERLGDAEPWTPPTKAKESVPSVSGSWDAKLTPEIAQSLSRGSSLKDVRRPVAALSR